MTTTPANFYSHRQRKPAPPPESLTEFEVPPFTMKELLAVVPKHCFELSTVKSMSYFVRDVSMIVLFAASLYKVEASFAASALSGLATVIPLTAVRIAYILLQSLAFTGLWVVAHETGHRAFSDTKWISDAVGFAGHAFLLVPYHPWRITHAKHHAATGHIDKDEVFVPRTRAEKGLKPLMPMEEQAKQTSPPAEPSFGEWLAEYAEDAPLFNFITITVVSLLGLPLYFFFNFGGQRSYPSYTNHFSPSAKLFGEKNRQEVINSDCAVIVMLSLLTYVAQRVSWSTVMLYYGFPYLITNFNVVMITFLQHTDMTIPHYSDKEWTFVKGALCTVDRNYFGWLGEFFLHSITSTHVLHHVCSRIPHYHAHEASNALKIVLGKHYHQSSENMLLTLWNNMLLCKTVDHTEDVMFFRDADGHAMARLAASS